MKKFLSFLLVLTFVFSSLAATSAATAKPTVYSNAKLGISITPPSGYTASASEQNSIIFSKKDNEPFFVYMSSLDKGMTLEKWAEIKKNQFKTDYNTSCVKLIKTEKTTINGKNCIKLYTSIKNDDEFDVVVCNALFVGKSYKYQITYSIKNSEFKSSTNKTNAEKYISSFKFTEPDTKVVGKLIDYSPQIDCGQYKIIKSDDLGFSLNIPVNWVTTSYNIYSIVDSTAIMFTMRNKQTLTQACENLKNSDSGKKVLSQEKLLISGNNALKYLIQSPEGNIAYTYLVEYNDFVYCFIIAITKYLYNDKNTKAIDKIIKTIKIENSTQSTTSKDEDKIDDYNDIFGDTSKSIIGDSFYKWSMSKPKDMTLVEADFDNTRLVYSSAKDDIVLYIYIFDNEEDADLDSIMSNRLEQVSKYTLNEVEKKKKNNQEYGVISFSNDEYTCVERIFTVKNNYYVLSYSAENKVFNSQTCDNLLDSFKTSFTANKDTRDLSTVNSNGTRTYKSDTLKWSVEVLPTWYDITYKDKKNIIEFAKDSDTYMDICMYSIDNSTTLDSVVEDNLNYFKKVYNTNLVQISQPQSMKISGVNAKKIELTYNIKGQLVHEAWYIFIGKNYRYNIITSMSDKTYTSEDKQKIESMISSFKFTEPDTKKLGKLVDQYDLQSSSAKTLSNSKYMWSMKLPSVWVPDNDINNNSDDVCYYSSNEGLYMEMIVNPTTKSLSELCSIFETNKFSSSMYKLESSETLSDKGTTVKKYIYNIDNPKSYYNYKEICYIINKNGYLYSVYFTVTDIRYSDYSKQVFDKIWQSMKFE